MGDPLVQKEGPFRKQAADMSNEVRSSTASHTPGPWVVARGRINCSGEFGYGAITTDEDEPWYIAKVESLPREEANARLIAAAPDMLAALQRLVNDSMFKNHPEASQMAIDAIAKATGEAPR